MEKLPFHSDGENLGMLVPSPSMFDASGVAVVRFLPWIGDGWGRYRNVPADSVRPIGFFRNVSDAAEFVETVLEGDNRGTLAERLNVAAALFYYGCRPVETATGEGEG